MSWMEQQVSRYKNDAAELAGMLPDVANAYHRFTGECFAAGELDEKTKQLIALGVALFANNEVCTFYHVQEALTKGASDKAIMEAAAVASAAASGHALSQGVMRVQEALTHGSIREFPQMTMSSAAVSGAIGSNDLRNDVQDTELAAEEAGPGMSVPGSRAVSPSY